MAKLSAILDSIDGVLLLTNQQINYTINSGDDMLDLPDELINIGQRITSKEYLKLINEYFNIKEEDGKN